ncbi:MAG: nucleotidyltransferase domain-containing protein [Clostridiales Family XIII bacterium]|jgi:predicted nucleotidyltransferase|nr:nucleotidyltransferase domain-containing protein [Clostridiales Family XIII bacterium]
MNQKTAKYGISDIKRIVAPIATEYSLGRLSLFGSYARGDATSDSDIDLLITEKDPVMSLFKLAGLHLALEKKLGMRVDVLAEDCLDKEFLANIRDEEVILYEG